MVGAVVGAPAAAAALVAVLRSEAMRGDEVLPGLWRFAVDHPEWEPGQDWPREVAWQPAARFTAS